MGHVGKPARHAAPRAWGRGRGDETQLTFVFTIVRADWLRWIQGSRPRKRTVRAASMRLPPAAQHPGGSAVLKLREHQQDAQTHREARRAGAYPHPTPRGCGEHARAKNLAHKWMQIRCPRGREGGMPRAAELPGPRWGWAHTQGQSLRHAPARGLSPRRRAPGGGQHLGSQSLSSQTAAR